MTPIEIELVHIADASKLTDLIASIAGVGQLDIASNVASLQLNEALIPRHRLINLLVQSGISMNRFQLQENNMQQDYLKAVSAVGSQP